MKLGTIRLDDRDHVVLGVGASGAITLDAAWRAAGFQDPPRSVLDIVEAQGGFDADLRTALDAVRDTSAPLDVETVRWRAPVTRPGKILGVAFNNRQLVVTAHVVPQAPMYFLKPPSSLTGHNCPIVIQENYGYTIPELEVAAVIGRRARNISESEALGHVYGYTIINDVTSNALKFKLDAIAIDLDPKKVRPEQMAWRRRRGPDDNELYFTYHTRSKGCDTFGPMGPWLTTADEIPDPNELEIRGSTNGEPFTIDSTANYQFSLQRVIADASRYFTLEPGDIIHFGTAGRPHGRFERGHLGVNLYQDAGPIAIEVPSLGRLSNPVQHAWKR